MTRSTRIFVKKLIFTFLGILVLATSVSVAWFAINSTVSQEGIDLSVDVTPNLIISSSSDLSGISVESPSPFSYSFSDTNNNKFVPCSHYVYKDGKFEYLTNLQYVINTGEIDQNTGLAPSYEYELAAPFTDGTNLFYYDYVVYIASTFEALTGKLTATIYEKHFYNASGTDLSTEDTFQAASIDFLVNDELKGTLNVAGKDITVNDASTTKTSLEIFNGTIPLNTSKTSIKITLRCYFDGALLKSATQAYVNTASIQNLNARLNVLFTAEETSS